MRWERLFADLEASLDDEALLERDALVHELGDEEWSRTPWRTLLAGHVELDVLGAGRLAGDVGFVNERLVRLDAGPVEHVVSLEAVVGVRTQGRADAGTSTVAARLGWPQVLRRARDDGDEVRVVRIDGVVVRARVERLLDGAVVLGGLERDLVVPLRALAVATFGV